MVVLLVLFSANYYCYKLLYQLNALLIENKNFKLRVHQLDGSYLNRIEFFLCFIYFSIWKEISKRNNINLTFLIFIADESKFYLPLADFLIGVIIFATSESQFQSTCVPSLSTLNYSALMPKSASSRVYIYLLQFFQQARHSITRLIIFFYIHPFPILYFQYARSPYQSSPASRPFWFQ